MGNKNLKRLATLPGFCLALLLGGCAAGSGGQLPEWVMTPPADNPESIYGIGEASSLRAARDDALGVIAGKLEIRVTADVQTETVLHNGREQSTTRNRVQTTTEALKLSDYQTVKSAEVGGRRLVLVSIDRNTLVSSILNDLDSLNSRIDGRLFDTGASSRLKRLYRLTLSRSLLIEGINKIALAQSVSENATLKQAQSARYQGLLEERERLQQSLVLGVRWDRATTEIGEKVLTLLLELGLHAEPHQSGKSFDGYVLVSGAQERREMFNESHVQLNAVVALKDAGGSEISAARYHSAASSLTDFESARKSANRLIAAEISKRGIWRALNMHRVSDSGRCMPILKERRSKCGDQEVSDAG